MSDDQMTKEEREFATKWHNLIYTFLNAKDLPEEDYYDIVVFGFLRAVKRYFAEPVLRKYSFSTIAWRSMESDLKNYRHMQGSQKRKACIVSLHSLNYGRECTPLEETISAPDRLMMQLETELLLHDLARKATQQQMTVVQLRSAGYNVREIARTQSIPMKRVQELLSEIRDLLVVVCHG